ncbi:hypothetical protein H2198_001194 [Neophaeococcomyces mojaviensis]|uniref:Uncharacterized protein n=1 Tax=Neophaeococcomyces mojaviensis TaxID=3383035 RepID=A0ACC3AI50_9EURO|nr:hypothetical protein H2198_001194 [Knufia sp. JES_112]
MSTYNFFPKETLAYYGRRYLRFILAALSLLSFIYLFDVEYYGSEAPFKSIIHGTKNIPESQLIHTISAIRPLPTASTERMKLVQRFQGRPPTYDIPLNEKRRRKIKATLEKSWKNYRQQAWLQDELRPVKGGGSETNSGWATTMINTLDTLWIMGLKKEFREAVRVVKDLDWMATTEQSCNMFRTATQQLGGLLSAYDLSKDSVLLTKAIELGEILYTGFDTENHMPVSELHFEKARAGQLVLDGQQSPAHALGLSLEFTRLTQLTGDNKYYDAVARVADVMYENQNYTKLPGLWPASVDLQNNIYNHDNTFTLGASSGMMYRTILNMYTLLRGGEPMYEDMYLGAVDTIIRTLFFRPMTHKKNLDVLFTGVFHVGNEPPLETILQHQACFAGGMFALGGRTFSVSHHVDLAANLTNSCIWAYSAFPTGIMPEISQMVQCPNLDRCKWEEQKWYDAVLNDYDGREDLPKGFHSARDPSYSLRGEAIESVFMMYRITGHEEYREHAWRMFEAIQAATETEYGNAAIEDVTTSTGKPMQTDAMDSLWLSATLKYFYLIFSPHDQVSLDEFVFNAAGHPLRIPKR